MRLRNGTAVIIPVHNEDGVIRQTIKDVQRYFDCVICINDGSRDNSAGEIKKTSAVLISHPINLGQGAALQTGIEWALKQPEIEYFVTFDADGQHDIKDVKVMLEVLKSQNLDIVLGSRFLGRADNIPLGKRVLLKAAIKFTNFFSGVKLTDTHNGLRVFNRKFAEQLNIVMPDMAHASEIIDKIGKGEWKYQEVPITVHYTGYSMSKGQSMFNSVNILFDLLLSKAGKK